MITPVILCGGVGTRLWPISRETNPKQFLAIEGDLSLFQVTAKRISDSKIFTKPVIVCNEQHKFKIAGQLEELGIEPLAIILEPVSKNTAPAIALAAHYLKEHHPHSQTMLIVPADHMIEQSDQFCKLALAAKEHCANNSLITFGINPTYPSTAYGYIVPGKSINGNCYEVEIFAEKPTIKTAEDLIKNHAKWNSGIFMFEAESYLQELKNFYPAIFDCCLRSVKMATTNYNFLEIQKDIFDSCEDISIDYAIFEHTNNAVTISMDLNWSDIGSWKALYDHSPKDQDQNYSFGKNYPYQTNNCLIYSQPEMSTITYGVENLCIITTKDAVLVINKDDSEAVKNIVNDFKKQNNPIVNTAPIYYRPWGYYQNILTYDSYKVKKLHIYPGSKISLQYHNKRSEHWVVTSGKAMVTHGNKSFVLEKEQSTYIPTGTIHRLENVGKEPLEIIEVQIGAYLEEDDIVRLEDKYGRVPGN